MLLLVVGSLSLKNYCKDAIMNNNNEDIFNDIAKLKIINNKIQNIKSGHFK